MSSADGPTIEIKSPDVRVKDDDLTVLRDRPDFQEWVRTLAPAKGK